MRNNVIPLVVKKGLCTGCGTCVAMCPNTALKIAEDINKGVNIPTIDETICAECGLCLKLCPRFAFDLCKQSEAKMNNPLIGNYINTYKGHSTDIHIRFNSSSGGLVTQLLIYALEKRLITGALITRMKKDYPLEAESFIARTEEDIINSSKSKYCPVSANVALREIIESNDEDKFAFVGLPCQIQALINAEQVNGKLRKKIVIRIGLFCSYSPNRHATRKLLEILQIKREEIIRLDYRGDGWPGKMKIYNSKNECVVLQHHESYAILGSMVYAPYHCLVCNDGTCEFADISFGDAWLPESKNDKIGESIIITRSHIGDKIIKQMKMEGKIETYEIDIKKVIQSQLYMLYLKKRVSIILCELCRINYMKYDNIKTDYMDLLYTVLLYICWKTATYNVIRDIIPEDIIKRFNTPFILIGYYKALIDNRRKKL